MFTSFSSVNQCLQHEIGFGLYQKKLLVVAGFAWAVDNLLLQGVAVILPQVQSDLHPPRVEYVLLALYSGLIVGATFWGILADVVGRRISWRITFFICGVFGVASGGTHNYVSLCSLVACIGFGVGGKYPVTGTLFLEHLPQSHQRLLTFLSAAWSVGQLVASLIVWVFIANYPEDKSWRYSLGCLAFAMFFCSFILIRLKESSKFLIATGRDEDAIKVLEYIAKHNGKSISLTTEKLVASSDDIPKHLQDTSIQKSFKRSFSHFSLSRVRKLFSTKRLAINSTLIILIWGILGLAYPLFNGFLPLYLSDRLSSSSNDQTYRDYTIASVCGIPGSVIASIFVDWTRSTGKIVIGGRKMVLAVSTILTGIFLFLFTTAKNEASNLGYACASTLTSNAMYGVLYAYTPEVFPGPQRGTGNSICSAFGRIMGVLAPIIKIITTNPDGSASSIGPNAPLFVSASLFIVSAVLIVLLPIETAGKAAL
ncbi:MFS general substrate transporter [Fomitiporia mediterranea MF3/22]|uniref:MFS general substrate transporter n=1 Tax=Fomitiporia mediterranea (strain MF3/22) TaxID=694068 RepID=UPI00044099F1|nr:MFS general substrate transporter [Fomitiporia mediterranea MF3/22]EJD03334.1 MFS general substrate transporter [Fomitiporia mediterranea MF3/22]